MDLSLLNFESTRSAEQPTSVSTALALDGLRAALRQSEPLDPDEGLALVRVVEQGIDSLVHLQHARPGGEDPVLIFRSRQVETRRRRLEVILATPFDEGGRETYFEALDSYHRSAERFLDALLQELELSPAEVQSASRRWRRRLQEALLLRRHLADFRFLAGRAAEKHTPDLRLRYAATELARFLGSDARRLLRAHDERVLIDLQRRLKQWFLGGATGEAAGRLLVDLSGVGQILSQVNHREELLVRDSELVRALPSKAEGCSDLMVRVHELYGVSDGVDAVLKQKQRIETRHLDLLRRAVGCESEPRS